MEESSAMLEDTTLNWCPFEEIVNAINSKHHVYDQAYILYVSLNNLSLHIHGLHLTGAGELGLFPREMGGENPGRGQNLVS